MIDAASAWNLEYKRQGIPSSHRDDPSGVLVWALANLRFLTDGPVRSAVDLGCGTGRNAVALAEAGMTVSAMDFSTTALDVARRRQDGAGIDFVHGDVTVRLPFGDGSLDFATDVFVYFHQLGDVERKNYRQEMHRILRSNGLLLVSLATNGDGYYSACRVEALAGTDASVGLSWDPVAEVGNILLSYDELLSEFSDLFDLQMSWVKRKVGVMHGGTYLRETTAVLWRAK
jgi:SAM-dependent methyltransferase